MLKSASTILPFSMLQGSFAHYPSRIVEPSWVGELSCLKYNEAHFPHDQSSGASRLTSNNGASLAASFPAQSSDSTAMLQMIPYLLWQQSERTLCGHDVD
ncbi:hypothetical protein BDW71DRAFT_171430, partial [Aspergillus fruticulosus]